MTLPPGRSAIPGTCRTPRTSASIPRTPSAFNREPGSRRVRGTGRQRVSPVSCSIPPVSTLQPSRSHAKDGSSRSARRVYRKLVFRATTNIAGQTIGVRWFFGNAGQTSMSGAAFSPQKTIVGTAVYAIDFVTNFAAGTAVARRRTPDRPGSAHHAERRGDGRPDISARLGSPDPRRQQPDDGEHADQLDVERQQQRHGRCDRQHRRRGADGGERHRCRHGQRIVVSRWPAARELHDSCLPLDRGSRQRSDTSRW